MKKYLNEDPKHDIKKKIGILCLIISIAGVFGFVYEFIFYYFNGGMKEFYYRGGNFLPWINIYAYGALLIFFFTFKNRKKPLVVFLKSFIICGLLELFAGWLLYTFFDGFRCWDYNTEILNFGNIGGYVCLRSVLFFGLSGLILIYVIIPICLWISNKFKPKTFLIICVIICSIFLLDEIYNLIIARLLSTPRASDIYKSIGFHYVNFK